MHNEIAGAKEFKIKTRLRSAEIAIAQVLFLFVLPIALLYHNIIPVSGRLYVLLFVSLLIYGVIKKEGWTEADFGLTFKTSAKAIKVYTVSTILALSAILLVSEYFELPPPTHWWTKPHFLFLFIVLSFFQEFAFRGFLMPLLGKIFPDTFTIVLVNALIFAGMHSIYPYPLVALPFAFIGGLFFSILYKKYPDLILVSISHSILNFAAVWFGFFVIK